VFAIFSSAPQIWITDVTLTITVILGIFSIIHAFWIRKEYLLRLEMRQNQISSVSTTSRGKRWEWLHSLWMLWTLTFGLSSWIAFLYIGIRTWRARWIMWGILYFAIFLLFAVSEPIFGQQSEVAEALTGLLIVSGIVSIVHAFSVRSDYLMGLENKLGEEFGDKKISYQPETEQTIQSESTSSKQRSEQHESPEGTITATDLKEDKPVAGYPTSLRTGTFSTPSAHKVTRGGSAQISETLTASSPSSISETYPLPLAYSWSLLVHDQATSCGTVRCS
jgi:ABC-type multidrug transport system fused ATPase/permease subunit